MLSKEQKIKLVLDIVNGKVPNKIIPVFKQPHFFCASEKDLCINGIFFDEDEFQEIISYLENFRFVLWVQDLEMIENIEKLISN